MKETEAVRLFSQFLGMLTEERVSQIISRQLLSCICNTLSSLPTQQVILIWKNIRNHWFPLNCFNLKIVTFLGATLMWGGAELFKRAGNFIRGASNWNKENFSSGFEFTALLGYIRKKIPKVDLSREALLSGQTVL